MPLYLYNGQLLVDNNALAVHENCCCNECECCDTEVNGLQISIAGVGNKDAPVGCPTCSAWVNGTYNIPVTNPDFPCQGELLDAAAGTDPCDGWTLDLAFEIVTKSETECTVRVTVHPWNLVDPEPQVFEGDFPKGDCENMSLVLDRITLIAVNCDYIGATVTVIGTY